MLNALLSSSATQYAKQTGNALTVLPANYQAWYRRACSHEALQNYSAACSDAAMAVQLSRSAPAAPLPCCDAVLQLTVMIQHDLTVVLLIKRTCDAVMDTACRGAQHERLQAAAKQSASASARKGANGAATAGITADADRTSSLDMAEVPPSSVPPLKAMLAVQNSNKQGRQLAVTRNIPAGTVLWTEQPYVHVLLKQHRKQVRLRMNLKQIGTIAAMCNANVVIAEHLFLCMLGS